VKFKLETPSVGCHNVVTQPRWLVLMASAVGMELKIGMLADRLALYLCSPNNIMCSQRRPLIKVGIKIHWLL